MKEEYRQLIHVLFGVAIMALALNTGREGVVAGLIIALVVGFALMQFKFEGREHVIVDFFLEKFERPSALIGKGAINYVVGALFLYSFAPTLSFALAITGVLAFGDGLATVVGVRHGETPLHFNKRKSWEGLAAFAGASFISCYYFIGWQAALLYAVVLAFVEGFDFGADDNLLIPFVAVVLSALTGVY